jgi:hypothetical protein
MLRFRFHSYRRVEMQFCKVRRADTKVPRTPETQRTKSTRPYWYRLRRQEDKQIPKNRKSENINWVDGLARLAKITDFT